MVNLQKKDIDKLTYKIEGAIEVHRHVGLGLLESVYQKCLIEEYTLRNLPISSEVITKVETNGLEADTELECDFLIENLTCLEIKSVEKVMPLHDAHLLIHVKQLNVPMSIFVNFKLHQHFQKKTKNIGK